MKRTSRNIVSRGFDFLRGLIKQNRAAAAQRAALKAHPEEAGDERLGEAFWHESLRDPTDFYLRCYRYFHRGAPDLLRSHRAYFVQEGRGFGEDAFHVMWQLIFETFCPRSYLEIGVFRGQALSLAGMLSQGTCATYGISPFAAVGDSVSDYPALVDYRSDTLSNYARFAAPPPTLLTAYSTDSAARELIASRAWDVIYIDGNHDYEVARQDWENCAAAAPTGGLVVLDDSGLSTSYNPPAFATGGHPGPSRLAAEIDRSVFEEILQVGHNRVFRRRA